MIELYKKYCSFEGRASRKEYNYLILAAIPIGIICSIVGGIVGNVLAIHPSVIVSIILVVVVLMVPGIATAVRRLHDHDLSGWVLLWLPFAVFAVTFVLAIVENLLFKSKMITGIFSVVFNIGYWFFFMAKRGTVGSNSYGADPLEGKI